jgi:predicted nucleotidyltransferase
MANRKTLTRGMIVKTLINALKPLDYVHAFYEGGAAAFNRIDKWSDIDLYLIVDDDKVNEVFLVVEKTLESLSPIKQKYEVPQLPWPGVSQAFYRLEDASEYLIIDLAILKLNSPDKFLEPEIHGNVVFYFSKNDKVKLPRLDRNSFIKKLDERVQRLQARFNMFSNFVQKEINRGNNLEALDLYHALTLVMLVEALRIKYNPFHYDFKMRYVHYELPPETTMKLEHLYFVKDQEDLQEKYFQANKWFNETMLEIDKKEIERLVRLS